MASKIGATLADSGKTMSPARYRLGAVLLLDPPVSAEIDGLRRALGDSSLDRIGPHVTLASPINVREEHLGAALADLRSAARRAPGPIRLRLGPPATFLPANPVLFLAVDSETQVLDRLHESLAAGPLGRSRSRTWPWVPHVTLLDGGEPEVVSAAVEMLAGYQREVEVERLVLLEERRTELGRRWVSLADSALGPHHVVARGGLVVELTRSSMIDPGAQAALGLGPDLGLDLGPGLVLGEPGMRWGRRPPIVITARRQGEVVGVGWTYLADDGGHIAVRVRGDSRRQGVGSHLLRQLESAVIDAGWECPVLLAEGPAAFYQARSAYSKATEEY